MTLHENTVKALRKLLDRVDTSKDPELYDLVSILLDDLDEKEIDKTEGELIKEAS